MQDSEFTPRLFDDDSNNDNNNDNTSSTGSLQALLESLQRQAAEHAADKKENQQQQHHQQHAPPPVIQTLTKGSSLQQHLQSLQQQKQIAAQPDFPPRLQDKTTVSSTKSAVNQLDLDPVVEALLSPTKQVLHERKAIVSSSSDGDFWYGTSTSSTGRRCSSSSSALVATVDMLDFEPRLEDGGTLPLAEHGATRETPPPPPPPPLASPCAEQPPPVCFEKVHLVSPEFFVKAITENRIPIVNSSTLLLQPPKTATRAAADDLTVVSSPLASMVHPMNLDLFIQVETKNRYKNGNRDNDDDVSHTSSLSSVSMASRSSHRSIRSANKNAQQQRINRSGSGSGRDPIFRLDRYRQPKKIKPATAFAITDNDSCAGASVRSNSSFLSSASTSSRISYSLRTGKSGMTRQERRESRHLLKEQQERDTKQQAKRKEKASKTPKKENKTANVSAPDKEPKAAAAIVSPIKSSKSSRKKALAQSPTSDTSLPAFKSPTKTAAAAAVVEASPQNALPRDIKPDASKTVAKSSTMTVAAAVIEASPHDASPSDVKSDYSVTDIPKFIYVLLVEPEQKVFEVVKIDPFTANEEEVSRTRRPTVAVNINNNNNNDARLTIGDVLAQARTGAIDPALAAQKYVSLCNGQQELAAPMLPVDLLLWLPGSERKETSPEMLLAVPEGSNAAAVRQIHHRLMQNPRMQRWWRQQDPFYVAAQKKKKKSSRSSSSSKSRSNKDRSSRRHSSSSSSTTKTTTRTTMM
jgi:hypothetical protein